MSFGNPEKSSGKGTSPQERIYYQGDLEPFLKQILLDYELGTYIGHELKHNGYEDFNLILHTTTGPIFLKCFAQWRSKEDCERYLDMIQTSYTRGHVLTPKLYPNTKGSFLTTFDNDGDHICAMKFLDGGNIWESKKRLTDEEQKAIIREAAKITLCEYKPTYVHDSWAIVNASETYSKSRDRIAEEDRKLLDRLMREFGKIEVAALPHSFVHGDVRSTNVMRHSDGHVYVIDFSVANWYPRVVELAVMLSDILFDPSHTEEFTKTYQWALGVYQEAGVVFTQEELKVLPIFVQLAHAMNIIGSSSVDATQYISQAENAHWMQLGRTGLHFTMSELEQGVN